MKITIFGSCCQDSLFHDYTITSIQNEITYPYYTEEILQVIRAIKGTELLTADERRWLFRSGMLERRAIDPSRYLNDFQSTDIFVLEIASRLSYVWNGKFAHHIITEPEYGFPYKDDIVMRNLSDEEIERGLLAIRAELTPKPMIVVCEKHHELVKLLEQLCLKHRIPFINPLTFFPKQEGRAAIHSFYKQYIDRPLVWNTVIYAWPQKAVKCDPTFYWGIGDVLRSISATYNYCRFNNLRLIVDFSMHPISAFLAGQTHMYQDYVSHRAHEIPYVNWNELGIYVQQHNPALLLTNVNEYHTSSDIKDFIKSLLKTTPEFDNKFRSKLPPQGYHALHFRLGDHHILETIYHKHDNISFEEAFKIYKENQTEKTILFSDSKEFKDYVKARHPDARMYDFDIAHMGCSTNASAVAGTLLEYLALANASSIKTYSTYPWISGFVNSVSKFFDIPVINLKP